MCVLFTVPRGGIRRGGSRRNNMFKWLKIKCHELMLWWSMIRLDPPLFGSPFGGRWSVTRRCRTVQTPPPLIRRWYETVDWRICGTIETDEISSVIRDCWDEIWYETLGADVLKDCGISWSEVLRGPSSKLIPRNRQAEWVDAWNVSNKHVSPLTSQRNSSHRKIWTRVSVAKPPSILIV